MYQSLVKFLLVTWCVGQPIITDQASVISVPQISVGKVSPSAKSPATPNDVVPDLATELTEISMDAFAKVLNVVMKSATEAGISALGGAVAAGTNATIEIGNAGSKVVAHVAKHAETDVKNRSTQLVEKAVDGVSKVKGIAAKAASNLLGALANAVDTIGIQRNPTG